MTNRPDHSDVSGSVFPCDMCQFRVVAPTVGLAWVGMYRHVRDCHDSDTKTTHVQRILRNVNRHGVYLTKSED